MMGLRGQRIDVGSVATPRGFLREYHLRSNMESSNSSLKRMFPAELQSERACDNVPNVRGRFLR